MKFPSILSLCLVFFLILLCSSCPHHAKAKMPDSVANEPCVCQNGGIRQTVAGNRCSCLCSAPWVAPTCVLKADEFALLAVTWDNSSVRAFAIDETEATLKKNIPAAGSTSGNIAWISRAPRYEASEREVVVLYSCKASVVETILDEVARKASYLQSPNRIAIDAWLHLPKDSKSSLFAQHAAKGDLLGEHDLPIDLGIGGSASAGGSKLQIMTFHIEFFVGALSVLVAAPLIEGILFKYFHPEEAELDRQHHKYGEGQAMSKAVEARRKAARARIEKMNTAGKGIAAAAAAAGNPLSASASRRNFQREDEDGDTDGESAPPAEVAAGTDASVSPSSSPRRTAGTIAFSQPAAAEDVDAAGDGEHYRDAFSSGGSLSSNNHAGSFRGRARTAM